MVVATANNYPNPNSVIIVFAKGLLHSSMPFASFVPAEEENGLVSVRIVNEEEVIVSLQSSDVAEA